ncbi:MAG: hypothetical protein EOO66_00030, partial [Methylobacterium sp.]
KARRSRAGALGRIPVTIEGGRVTLSLPADQGSLPGDRILNRVRGLGRLFGLEGRIVEAD